MIGIDLTNSAKAIQKSNKDRDLADTEKKEAMKKGTSNGRRAGGKGSPFNLVTLKRTASKYNIYQQDYIDAYTAAFNEATKLSSTESTIKAKAKHNGTNAAINSEQYNEKRLKIYAQNNYGKLASLYHDSYIEAFELKRKQMKAKKSKKSNKKVSSIKSNDIPPLNSSSMKLHFLLEALDSEFENLPPEDPVVEANDFSILHNKNYKVLTPSYMNFQSRTETSTESSSDSEEYSFSRIKEMKNLRNLRNPK